MRIRGVFIQLDITISHSNVFSDTMVATITIFNSVYFTLSATNKV